MNNKPENTSGYRIGGIAVESPVHKKALTFSLLDGIFANVMVALVDTFAVAAAVFLDAPAIAIALLTSLPLLLSSLGQLLIPLFTKPETGRKKYVLAGTTSQATFLIGVALSGYLPEPVRPWAYVFFFALYGFCGNVIAGFWIAWMGDLVPQQVRGRHFAWRNRIFSATQLLCALCAGVLLRQYNTSNAEWIIFSLVFLIAGFARFISTGMMSRQYEPPAARIPAGKRSLVIRSQPRPFLFYCFSAALMQGTVAIAGPFFNVWYIRDLHYDYFTLAAVTVAMVLGTIVSLPFWGKIADSLSNRVVIIITVFLIATVPLPFLIFEKPWQIWLLNFYTGICWSGYNLCNFNYLLAAAGKNRIEQNISFAVAITGIVNFLFSLLGGFLATCLPIIFGYQLQSLFLLSALLRFCIFGLLVVRYPKFEPGFDHSLRKKLKLTFTRTAEQIKRKVFAGEG